MIHRRGTETMLPEYNGLTWWQRQLQVCVSRTFFVKYYCIALRNINRRLTSRMYGHRPQLLTAEVSALDIHR